MNERQDRSEVEWPVSWRAAREVQRRDMARATPVQRLQWLEEALRVAYVSGALSRAETPHDRRRRGVPPEKSIRG
jgi:hypothetical protein